MLRRLQTLFPYLPSAVMSLQWPPEYSRPLSFIRSIGGSLSQRLKPGEVFSGLNGVDGLYSLIGFSGFLGLYSLIGLKGLLESRYS
jgi:hypothetical protein